MSTALLSSMYDFVEFRNPSVASASVTVAAATGVDNNKSPAVPVLPPSSASCLKSADRLSGLFQQQLQSSSISISSSSPSAAITASSSSSSHPIKMTGGIRRTVSSATPCSTGMGSMNNHTSARSVHQQQAPLGATKSLNTQSSSGCAVRGAPATQISSSTSSSSASSSKDPHKKLDRSFSEPAEKKNSSAAAAAAAAASAQASSLGPSSRYKTELCRSFAEVGSCKYGDKCQFAHGEEELRTVSRHPKFKTENCKSFHSTGFCPYGPRCHFIHNDESKKSMLSGNGNGSSQSNINNCVPSSPSAVVGSQRSMFDASNNQQQQQHVSVPPFPSTSPPSNPSVLNNNSNQGGANNLVRPKALSLGSYSLGSSGEISSPSSQSGSPTSLNSFFTEDSAGFPFSATPFGLSSSTASSRLQNAPFSSAFAAPSSANNHHNQTSPFSFSPDSAFVSFNGANANSNASSTTSGSSLSFGGSQKCIFGGSQPTLSSHRFSPVDHLNHQQHQQQQQQINSAGCETANSVFFSLFGDHNQQVNMQHNNNQNQQHFSDLYRTMSPIGKPLLTSQLSYPIAPESPVDSVASEIEALKLGEPIHHGHHHLMHQHSGFAPISPSFSSSSLSNASSASPPNGTLHAELEASLSASGFGTVHIPRLPTFTRFAANGQLAHE